LTIFETARQYLASRRTAYIRTFLAPGATLVLKDLSKFCRANESTFHTDPRAHAVAEGRREVWLRIQRHLQLTDDQLWDIYGGKSPNPPQE
jgi:hypothetical protein